MTGRSRHVPVRGLDYHVRHWGPEDATPIVMLHGWLDNSALFEPLVNALTGRWHVIAPDWRGCGASEWPREAGTTGYRFHDYLADLDALLAEHVGSAPVFLVGHSLGANVAGQYAGIRPERVARLVCLDAAEGTDTVTPDPAARIARWIDQAAAPKRFPDHPDLESLETFLRRQEPRWPEAVVRHIARHRYRRGAEGRWQVVADPAHAVREPLRYRTHEVDAIWSRAIAPVLAIDAFDPSQPATLVADPAAFLERRQRCFRDFRREVLAPAGHFLHVERPLEVAGLVEAFLRG